MWLQLIVVLAAIIIGARLGGIGLGVMGGLGLAVLCFVFGLQPTAPPIDVMLMIVAVISAASCMQAAGGLDYLVKLAERMLRKHPSRVTLLSPLVTYLFTFVAGTGHIAYSVLPVITEVARETKIRPERPLGIAVIASQQAITASPISAATVALLGMLAGFDISLFDILKISVPATLIGVLVGAFCSMKVGRELEDDPEYQRRLKEGMIEDRLVETASSFDVRKARISVGIFLLATFLIVLFGSIDALRPTFTSGGKSVLLDMPSIIEIIMLSTSALILLFCRIDGIKAVQGSILFGRHAGSHCHLRHCLDGRYVHCRQPVIADRFHRTHRPLHAVAVRGGSVRDVYPAVQPGRYHPGRSAAGHCFGCFPLDADSPFPGSERLFLHSQLSDRSGGHQFRPYGNDPYREIYPEPFVHDAGSRLYGGKYFGRIVVDIVVNSYLCV